MIHVRPADVPKMGWNRVHHQLVMHNAFLGTFCSYSNWHLLWTNFWDSKWCLDPWCSRNFQKRGNDESLLVPMALRGMESQLSLFCLVTPNPLEMNIECTQTVNVCYIYLHFFTININQLYHTLTVGVYDNHWLVVSNILFNLHPYLGKIPILTNISQKGWNNQLVNQI